MMLNWDEFDDEGETATETVSAEQLCPDGVHVATIGWVKPQSKDWAKSKGNPDGKCLTVRLDIKKGIKAVFDSIPLDRRGSIEALCRSAGIAPPRGQWDETQLRDTLVTVETALAVSKQGRDYVKVLSYKPGPAPLPADVRERPARTQTQKADAAASMPDDDLPF